MAVIEMTTKISISLDKTDLASLEVQLESELRKLGKQMLVQVCQEIEAQALGVRDREVKRQRIELRRLLSRFGWITLPRSRVKDASGRSWCLLDEKLGLEGRERVTPWVKERAMYCVTQLPYRPAAAIFSLEVGEELDHRMLWRLAQKEGHKLVVLEDQEWKRVFEDGEVPEREEKEREIVVAEVDGVLLNAQREEGKRFEARLGVMFSGRKLESETAKHPRYRLVERFRYGGVEDGDEFGEKLFIVGEKHLGLSRAKHILLVGDGASWIEPLGGGDRYRATYQLDWWHLERKIWDAFGDRPEAAEHLVACLCQHRPEEILSAIKIRLTLAQGVQERLERLQAYLESNWNGLYGAHSLLPKLSPAGRQALVVGSGAIEKHNDIVIDRRMKGRGMRWTKKGANNLLKLQLRRLEGEALAA